MFADPQSVTYNTVAKSLPRISAGIETSEYKLYDTSGVVYDLTLGHQFKTRNRVFAKLRRDAFASDPITPANNILASMSATLSCDFPQFGLTATDMGYLVAALTGWATGAQLAKLIQGET